MVYALPDAEKGQVGKPAMRMLTFYRTLSACCSFFEKKKVFSYNILRFSEGVDKEREERSER